MQPREGRSGLAVEARGAVVGFGTGLFAVVAADAQALVDQQHVGRLAEALLHQEGHDVAGLRLGGEARVLREALAYQGLHLLAQRRIAREQRIKAAGVETDRLGRDIGANGCASSRAAHQPHLADVIARSHIGGHDLAAADIARDGDRAATDQVQRVCLIALGENHLACLVVIDARARGHALEFFVRSAGSEGSLDRTNHEVTINLVTHGVHHVDQLQDLAAWRFDQHAARARKHGRRAAPARQQAHFAKEMTGTHRQAIRILIAQLDIHRAIEYGEEGIGVVVPAEHRRARSGPQHVAAEYEFPELQRIDVMKQWNALLHQLQCRVYVQSEWQRAELLLEQWMIRRPDVASQDVLDDLIALVHRLLDQRITAERTDHVETADTRFVAGRECRQRHRVGAREGDAAGFDEAAWRCRADAGDHAVAGNACLTIGRVEHQHIGARRAARRLDGRDIAAVVAADPSRVDGLADQLEVAILDARKLVAAIDDHDLVVRGKRHGILDRRIACADHDDHFAVVFVRVIELVLHAGQVGSRPLESA